MNILRKGLGNSMNGQRGQAILFVIVAMTIALAVVANVSVRTLSSLSATSRSDTSSRVIAAAEGGAERFLTLGNNVLKDISQGASATTCPLAGNDVTYDSAKSACVVTFNPNANDNVTSKAYVTVSNFTFTKTDPDRYEFNVPKNYVKEVNLAGYDGELEICWSATSSFGADYNDSDLYISAYGIDNNDVESLRTAVKSKCSNCFPSDYEDSRNGYENSSGGKDGYDYCYTTSGVGDLPGELKGVRIKSLMNDSRIGVYDSGDTLPDQGYKITSTGELLQTQDAVPSKTVTVYKSYPYLPAVFDWGIYSE